jgi:N-methylhydantoinase B
MPEHDPITFEVIKNALDSIADEMAIVLMRSAYSPIVRDSLDYSTAVCNRDGVMVAQGLTTPLHLGSFPDAMRHLVTRYGGRMRPGDVFALNDPYGAGGIHLPDIYVIKPIFCGEAVEGYAATVAHHTDVGGISPGSNSIHSTEIYQEGLRIPLLKLYDAGEPNETLFSLIERNVRVPVKVLGDVRAQVAACGNGERTFGDLLTKYGAPVLQDYLEEVVNFAERRMRAEIGALPDGVYEFTDFIDGLGDDPDPIVFHVRVTIAGETISVDWAGTSPQVKGGINSPLPFTRSATYLAIRSLVDPAIPNSEGYMKPIRVSAPPGTIVNPLLPGPCAARGITGYRMFDTMLGALSQAIPDRVPSAGEGGASLPSIGGYENGKPFVHVETILGTWGARPSRDGYEGISHPGANQSNQPIELIEAELPLRVRRYGLVKDSGGAGRYRGGLALIREYQILAEEASFTIRSDRQIHLPYGLHGGWPGTPSRNVVNPGPGERVLPPLPMQALSLKRGDVFCHTLPGGGGFGDPLERDPHMVLEDVLDEKLSADYARRVYGVVIDLDRMRIDPDGTGRLRKEMAASRGAVAESASARTGDEASRKE